MLYVNRIRLSSFILLLFVLSACGGGGGGGGGATTTTPTSPVFTSGSAINVNENTSATGYTANAPDADGDTVTYSLTGGTDQTAFSINTNSGVLSFVMAPDFEIPTDSNADNTYIVEITATDGTNLVPQIVTVRVLDVAEGAATFSIGGTISGLNGQLALQNTSNGDLKGLSGNGAFFFTQLLADGEAFNVVALNGPFCTVSNGQGTISSANVININIVCTSTDMSFINFGIGTEAPSVVTAAFRVIDTSNNPVSGLTVNDFNVLEDGVVVTQAESFKDLEPVGAIPYTFYTVVAVDISSSLTLADIQQVKATAKAIITNPTTGASNLLPNQQVAVYTFDGTVTEIASFTSDANVLTTAIDGITRGGPSTNLYGAIVTGMNSWTDSYSLTNISYGAMIIVTDGDDTSAINTEAQAISAVGNKALYAIPVGSNVNLTTLQNIAGVNNVLPATNFSQLGARLNDVVTELSNFSDGLYLLYYATPKRAGNHTINISIDGNTNTAAGANLSGSFNADGFSDVLPEVVISGDTTLMAGMPITWNVSTRWSNDAPNYSWNKVDPSSFLLLTPTADGASVTLAGTGLQGMVDVTVTDNNWGISYTKTVSIFPVPTPQNLAVIASATENQLSWDAVGTASYQIYWNNTGSPTSADNVINILAGTTSYTHTNFDPTQFYYYTVVAIEGGASSVPAPAIRSNYSVGGSISGLTATGLVLQNNLGDNLAIAGGITSFEFVSKTPVNASYSVSILNQPTEQLCIVSSGSGISNNNITNVRVNCIDYYTVGGTVTGLTASGLVLQNNGSDNLIISANGAFNFNATFLPGGNFSYNVTILSQPTEQLCMVNNASGTVNVDVSNVSVNCVDYYTASGTISGLTGGIILQNNAGDDLTVNMDGVFTFGTTYIPGSTYSYNVSILTQPFEQLCTLSNAIGTASAAVSNITVTCVDYYTVSGSLNGLTGGTVVLQNNGGDDLAISANGAFTFPTSIIPGGSYSVSILTTSLAHRCTVAINPSGSSSSDISNVGVGCVYYQPVVRLDYDFKQIQLSWGSIPGATYYKVLENPDGVSGYSQVGADITATSANIEIPVHLHDWINSSYMVSACNASECVDSQVVSTSYFYSVNAIGDFKASNPESDDRFGYSVSVSGDGNTMAVGALYEDSNATGINGDQINGSALHSGAVYVFTKSNGVWVQQAYVKASNTFRYSEFGNAIALSDDGNTMVVGSYREHSSSTGINGDQLSITGGDSGAVYVFTRTGTTWSQQAYVKASNAGSDSFGFSVGLSSDGNTLAVGAIREGSNATGVDGIQADNSLYSAGAVYVFSRSGTTWTQQAYVKASNTGDGDLFGQSVTLSADGNTLAVGANGEASNATGVGGNQADDSALAAGAAYVFSRSGATWTQQAYIKASIADVGDEFGFSMALSDDGNTLAVGAYKFASNKGAVYVFVRNSGWSQQAHISWINAGVFAGFGYSLDLSSDGNTLAVGAPIENSAAVGISLGYTDSNSALNSGAVSVHTRVGAVWSHKSYVKASNTQTLNYFGSAVSLSNDGNTMAIGVPGAYFNTSSISSIGGAVYLY